MEILLNYKVLGLSLPALKTLGEDLGVSMENGIGEIASSALDAMGPVPTKADAPEAPDSEATHRGLAFRTRPVVPPGAFML